MQRSGECGGQSTEVSACGDPVLDGIAAAPSVVGSQQPWLWTASGVKAATAGVHANRPSPLKAVGVFVYLASFAAQATGDHVEIADTDTDAPPYSVSRHLPNNLFCAVTLSFLLHILFFFLATYF